MTFTSGGVVYVVRLDGDDPLAREAIEFGREEFQVSTGRIAPAGDLIAYHLGLPDDPQVYVRPVDSSGRAGDAVWQVSRNGSDRQATSWRSDGEELYFTQTSPDTKTIMVMAVPIVTEPAFVAGDPELLFAVPGDVPRQKFVGFDGRQFVFIAPVESNASPGP